MKISVVIPTCERKARLVALLHNLERSTHPVDEVIIVDSGNDRLLPDEISQFSKLNIQYTDSERSVCIQRNKGINMARSPWIFLCDDDIEIPADYLEKLIGHLKLQPHAGAVSGRWLEKHNGEWKAGFAINSTGALLWKYIFQLGIWGEINLSNNNAIVSRLKKYYLRKGNHISNAGWPVNTIFDGDYFVCPVYSLGASLVKIEWLMQSPFDETLDPHGIGDNYGVALGFPEWGIHIVNQTFVYHHKEPANRLNNTLQYYRRLLALAYFIKTMPSLRHISNLSLLWSLTGNALGFLRVGNMGMTRATIRAMWKIMVNRNPYDIAKRAGRKRTIPML